MYPPPGSGTSRRRLWWRRRRPRRLSLCRRAGPAAASWLTAAAAGGMSPRCRQARLPLAPAWTWTRSTQSATCGRRLPEAVPSQPPTGPTGCSSGALACAGRWVETSAAGGTGEGPGAACMLLRRPAAWGCWAGVLASSAVLCLSGQCMSGLHPSPLPLTGLALRPPPFSCAGALAGWRVPSAFMWRRRRGACGAGTKVRHVATCSRFRQAAALLPAKAPL